MLSRHRSRPERAACPNCAGGCSANEPLAPLTWFRTGGPAQALFTPADESDLAYFLANLPRDIPVTVVGLGSNLIVRDGGIAGRRDPARARLRRRSTVEDGNRVRAGAGAPDVQVARAAQEAGIAGLAFLSRHSRRDRRRAAHERRRLWRRDQGRSGRGARRRPRRQCPRLSQRRDGLHLSPLRRAGRRDLHRRRCFRARRAIRAAILAEMNAHHRSARRDAAASTPHRRLDLQEPAGQQGLAADRCRRLPRPRRRRRAGVRDALQFPDQPRQRDGGRHRRRSARRSAAACRTIPASSWSGRSSGSAIGAARA